VNTSNAVKNVQTCIWRIPADEAGPCPPAIRERLIAGISGELPGCVHQALLAAGLIPDPFFGTNADGLGWIEHLHWILEAKVDFIAGKPASPANLILDGVDTYATVFLNDQRVAATDNAFMRYTLPVTGQALSGQNRLRLEFRPVEEVIGPDPKRYNCAFFNQYRVHVRRMQCTFGWDWVHKFITFGLLYAPQLAGRPQVVFPGVLTEKVDARSARIQARWDISNLAAGLLCDVEVSIHSPSGKIIETKTVSLGSGLVAFTITDPVLWNPTGYGEQPLYRATFKPVQGGVAVGEEVATIFGIRTVELLTEFDREGSEEARFTLELSALYPQYPLVQGREFGFRVNGTDVFALGGNWVPCDPFPGAQAEDRKEQILRQFAESGGNAIRVWGGGIYETPRFYDTCAKLGIMVLQDFMMSCADYPVDDAGFMAKLAPEIDQAVLRLRGHTAIIHWYGDNENAMNDGEHAPGKAWFEISEKLSRPALEKHDLGRAFTASCPFFGTPSLTPLQGDCHISVFFSEDRSFMRSDMKDYRDRLDRTVGRFGSEYALYGAPDKESLVRFMPKDKLEDSALWEFHTKDNPCHPPGEIITLFNSLERSARNIFGPFKNSDDRLSKFAYVHYETTRLAVEASRRKQPFCRGLLFWMLNDCWPASGWSMIDYYSRPKAAYYGFRHAAKPVHCSFRLSGGKLEAWVSNNSTEPVTRRFTLWFETWGGAKTPLGAIDATIPAGASRLIIDTSPDSIVAPQGGVFFAEGGAGETGWYFHGMPYEMTPPEAVLNVETLAQHADTLLCSITANSYARVVTLSGTAVADDNYFDLRAGEVKTITLKLSAGLSVDNISLKAWNAEPVYLRPKR
jgi:beta-mannosidase